MVTALLLKAAPDDSFNPTLFGLPLTIVFGFVRVVVLVERRVNPIVIAFCK